jgi:hypothetical protein
LTRFLGDAAPLMSSMTRVRVLAVTDRLEDENRQLRAHFLLGAVSEEQYFAGLRQHQREAFASLKQGMPVEQFKAVFRWDPDHDPFDPEGALPAPEETFTVGGERTKK